MNFLSRLFVVSLLWVLSTGSVCFAQNIVQKTWQEIEADAVGQTIYFNAWGGSESISRYILWAAKECKQRYGFDTKHVKVTDISEVVGRVLAEKTAGRHDNGSVDLLWINGENFYAMKKNDLLLEPYSQILPNIGFVDTENKPSTLYDFTVAVDNLEVPWGMAQLVFMYDSERLSSPPQSMEDLLTFAEKNPGQFTYPAPPAFEGTTFLKQVLSEMVADPTVLQSEVNREDFDKLTQPLWDYLDTLHPLMWRKGKVFVTTSTRLLPLLDNSEISIAFTFNPNEPSRAVENGELPETIRSYVHDSGMIANTHFVGIPYNARSPEAALVFANFLLSPEAQARKNDPQYWGDPTVLSMEKLSVEERSYFDELKIGPASLRNEDLGKTLPEPHASWMNYLEKAWLARYAQ